MREIDFMNQVYVAPIVMRCNMKTKDELDFDFDVELDFDSEFE
jgi:hypothetical protein